MSVASSTTTWRCLWCLHGSATSSGILDLVQEN